MRKVLALSLGAASVLVGCGKSDLATIKPSVLPIYVCWLRFGSTNRPCQHRFNAGRLISLRLDAANSLAERHGYSVRRIAPLAKGEFLTLDLQTGRIDVECHELAEDCVVVRIVEQG